MALLRMYDIARPHLCLANCEMVVMIAKIGYVHSTRKLKSGMFDICAWYQVNYADNLTVEITTIQ